MSKKIGLISRITYFLSKKEFKLNWLVKYNLTKKKNKNLLLNLLNKFLNYAQKSIVVNLIIVFIGMFICDTHSLILTNLYLFNVEQLSNYYIDFISKK